MRSAADLPYGVGYPLMSKPCHNGGSERKRPADPLAGGKAGRSLNLGDGFSGRELPRAKKHKAEGFRKTIKPSTDDKNARPSPQHAVN